MTRLLYFWAEWCKQCYATGPLVRQTAKDREIELVEYDVEDFGVKELAAKFDLYAIPAVALIVNDKVVYRGVGGLINRAAIEARL